MISSNEPNTAYDRPELKPETCTGCPLYSRRRIHPAGSTKQTKILILGEYPALTSPQGGQPFKDRAGSIVRTLLKRIRQPYYATPEGTLRWATLDPYFCYVAQCATDDRPNKVTLTKCRPNVETLITQIKPKLIITLGALTLQSLFKQTFKFDSVRGTYLKYQQGSGDDFFECDVLPTFTPRAVLAKSGLYEALYRDLQSGFLRAENQEVQSLLTEDDFRQHYRFPHTVDEVRILIDDILNYSNEQTRTDTHIVAVDTETTSLEPHDPNAKMIAISFAWDRLRAATVILDHPKGWWTASELEQVKEHVKRLLASQKPKVLHNDKFDRKFIFHSYGWQLNRVVWDTLCGEHLIEEDKKGEYSLKTLTKERLPQYANYEGRVDELREAHGGGTRAGESKKYRKAMLGYQKKYLEYLAELPVYEAANANYLQALEERTARYAAEKIAAKKEKRKIDQSRVGPRPKKPRLPRTPTKPERQEPFNFADIPLPDLELYAAVDADVTRQLLWFQNAAMNKEYVNDKQLYATHKEDMPYQCVKHLMKQHVIPTSQVLADMEFTGFPVDVAYVHELDQKLQELLEKTEKELYALAGQPFVIGNPQAITRVLFSQGFYNEGEKIILPRTDDLKRTPKGQLKADEKALLYIANTYKYDFPRKVITYRKAAKARTPFLTNVMDHAVFDGRMHSSFHITGTATGRLSSSEENLQNCPKKLAGYNIKKIFIPPPEMVLVNTDAKGAEVRIFASYAKDVRLSQAIWEGLDAHSFFTAEVYKVKYEDVEAARVLVDQVAAGVLKVSPQQLAAAELLVKRRTNCKRVVFGVLYGAHAPKIAETAGISLVDAQAVINLMFEMFPSIPQYIRTTEREVSNYLGVYTKTGRKRRFPLAERRAFASRCFRQAVNFKIQSTSSDIVLWVLNQIHPIVKYDLGGQFHATVHDSIVFSIPPKYLSQIKPLMKEYGTDHVSQAFPWLTVPFLWDVEAGDNYGEVGNIDEYIKGHSTQGSTDDEHEIISDQDIIQELNESFLI